MAFGDRERHPGDDAASVDGLHARFDTLVDEHGAGIWRFAYRLTGSAPRADDLTQDAYLQAWRSLSSLREPRAARSWLYAITLNCLRKRLRTASRRPRLATGLEHTPETAGRDLTPLDALAQRDAIENAVPQPRRRSPGCVPAGVPRGVHLRRGRAPPRGAEGHGPLACASCTSAPAQRRDERA